MPAEKLMPRALELAKKMAGNHPGMVNRYKAMIHEGGAVSYGESRELERRRADQYYKAMTPDDFQAMQKFLASRSKGKTKGKAKL